MGADPREVINMATPAERELIEDQLLQRYHWHSSLPISLDAQYDLVHLQI